MPKVVLRPKRNKNKLFFKAISRTKKLLSRFSSNRYRYVQLYFKKDPMLCQCHFLECLRRIPEKNGIEWGHPTQPVPREKRGL